MALDYALIALFIPTFALVSATPGMCMTLALTLGMSIGFRKTLWMMWGELAGVALVAVLAVVGVAKIMLGYPSLFIALKYIGGAYLVYIGVQMWQAKGKLALNDQPSEGQQVSPIGLLIQGFVTAVANPKGWAFTVSLLPPFINADLPMAPQLSVLVFIILCTELTCMMLYASGGKTLKKLLAKNNQVKKLNRISGSLMIAVGIWLALS